MITFDTSALIAAIIQDEPDHRRVMEVMGAERGPLIIPAGILAEVGFVLERRFGYRVLVDLFRDIRAGDFLIDCGDRDIDRIEKLVTRYADLRLGFVDAAVIACAERNGGRVLTLDLRHFGVVAREGTFTILP